METLSGRKVARHNKKPTFRSQKLENVNIALSFLERDGLTLVNIDSTDIVDGKLKLILGLVWTLILHYSISMPIWEGDEGDEKLGPKQRLLGWIQGKVSGSGGGGRGGGGGGGGDYDDDDDDGTPRQTASQSVSQPDRKTD